MALSLETVCSKPSISDAIFSLAGLVSSDTPTRSASSNLFSTPISWKWMAVGATALASGAAAVGVVPSSPPPASAAAALCLEPAARGLHSSAFQLNLSALYGIGGARRGCVARI